MPSPFPGMDPYLEGARWMRFHAELSVEIARQLSARLSPRYVAHTNERFVTTAFDADEGVATVIREPIRHLTVEIRGADDDRLVTAIEVLSPTNKRGDGWEEYRAKREQILRSTAHLIEIDLLRTGRRVPMRKPLPARPYFVLLGRAEQRPFTDVWPLGLKEPLPTFPVPLLAGDADISHDLQEAVTSVYDTFHYARTIDYSHPPEIPLPPEDVAWAEERLSTRRRPS